MPAVKREKNRKYANLNEMQYFDCCKDLTCACFRVNFQAENSEKLKTMLALSFVACVNNLSALFKYFNTV